MNADITIYSAPCCTFCHAMIKILEQLKSNEKIPLFNNIDISQNPEIAEKLHIRTVPFISIKGRIFIGKMTTAEIAHWYLKEDNTQGHADYFNWQLNKGEMKATESTLLLSPQLLTQAIKLLLDSETSLTVKIGLMALIEGFENTDQLRDCFSIIKQNSEHNDHRIRTDVTELILLSQHKDAKNVLTKMTLDDHPDVSEAALDALKML